jgi:hypothetical protein
MQAVSAATYHSQPSFAVGTPSEPSQPTTAAAVISCTVCKDRGGCPSCHGATVFESKPCRTCRTTGLCPVCSRAQA